MGELGDRMMGNWALLCYCFTSTVNSYGHVGMVS